jgi:hypothetical protein
MFHILYIGFSRPGSSCHIIVRYLAIIQIDWLIIYCFTSRTRIFHLNGDVTITGEGLQNKAYAWRSGPMSREGSLSCHTCCNMGPRITRPHQKDQNWQNFIQSPLVTHKGCGGYILTRIFIGPHSVASYDMQVNAEDLFLPTFGLMNLRSSGP